ncbi:LamG-like jellyroll fold domain-containing protein [Emticicia sp. SJ17W-69]|uniref:Ig-like domain-containing protein n=1 Tax=Emticicia sp. SJ17W-69 TaxID=3421657 RepID=UPI003EC11032
MKKILIIFFLSRIAFGQEVVSPTPTIATLGSTINVYFTNPSNNAGPFEVKLYQKEKTSCYDTCRSIQSVKLVASAIGNSSAISLEIPLNIEPTGSKQLIECIGIPCDTYYSYCLTICPSCFTIDEENFPIPCYEIELIEGIFGGGGGSVLQSLNLSQSQICQNSTLTATFQHQKINADNNFTVEISDQNGNFESPIASTTIAGNTATTASLVIPSTAPSSNGYILRVKSSYPVSSIQSNLIIGILSPPTITTTIVTAGNLASLTAACTNGAVKWYDQAFGGTLLQTGNSYSTPVLTANTTYFASCEDGSNCFSQRTPVTVIINVQIPSQPEGFTESSTSVCKGKSNVIYTVPNVAGVTYNWSYSGTGATFSSTTNSVSINFDMNATAGTLSVTANNGAGTSPARTLDIVLQNGPCEELIAHYPLDGTADDVSGNNLHGVISGTVLATPDRFGNPNSAMHFNGDVNNRISVADHFLLRPKSVTLATWVKMSGSSFQAFVGKNYGNCIQNPWQLGFDGSNLSSWSFYNASACGEYSVLQYSPFPRDSWVHLVQVVDTDNDIHKLYLNGNLVASQAYTGEIIYDDKPVFFGMDIDNGGMFGALNGDLDDVRIYGSAFTDQQVLNLYNVVPCTVSIGANATTLCEGSDLALSAPPNFTYSWTGPNGFTSNLQNPTISNISTAASGIYSLSIVSANCSATATSTINVKSTASCSGLIAYYKLDGNATDFSGNNLHGTIHGTLNSATDVNGNPTGSLHFDGNISNYISVNDNALLHPANITISAWVKLSGSNFQAILSKPLGTNITNSWQFLTNNDYLISVLGLDNVSNLDQILFSPSPINRWINLVQVIDRDNDTHKFYINGELIDTHPFTGEILYDNHPLLLGADIDLGNLVLSLNGDLDEVKIFGSAFSNSQIKELLADKCGIDISSNSPLCSGNSLTLFSNKADSYLWTGPNSFTSSLQNPTISNVTALATGNYMVTVTNLNGCTATATTNITINPLPIPTIGSNSPKCVGSTLNLTASGGTSYSWAGVNGFSSTAQNPTIPNVTALATGNYMVTVTNANGCTATATTAVTINPLPTPTIGSNSPKCVGSTLNLTASGGTSYSWAGVNGFSSTAQNPTIPNVTALATGNYMVTATNANGCTATATTAVTINPLPTPTIGSNSPKCVGSTLNLTASGGTSYSWTGVNGFNSTIQNPTIPNVTALTTGNYMVTVTNANGCTATATTAVTINPLPTPTIGSNSPKCVGSTLNFTASGGTSYSWTGVNGFSSTAQNPTIPNVTALATGNYMVTVTNANGCTATATTAVTINPLPTPTIGSNSPKCVGSTLNFTASGGTSYSWTGVNGFSSTAQNPTIPNVNTLATGNYMVTVTNANGCTATATTAVTINPLPTPTIGSNSPKCVGSTLNLTASGGTSYSWTGVNGFSSTAQNPTIPNVTALTTGNYMVTVTNANGCTATATTAVTINPLPTPTIGSNSPKCVGSTLNLTASGGTSYSWTGVNGFSSTIQNPTIPNVTALTTGNYMVTVTNANGCTATATTNVTINPLPIPTIGSNSPKCVGSTLNLTASGGTSYSWTGVNGFSSTAQNPTIPNVTALATGNYMVTVTNANGCTATATTAVTINPLPTPTIGSNSPKCVGSTLNFTASGGTSYSWTGVNGFSSTIQNPTIPNVTALTTGNYMVTVTNANGCTATATTAVTINPLPIPTIGSNSPKCVGSTLNLTASGGTSYSWAGVNGFSSTAQNPTIPNVTALATGNYMVTVTNANGCTATATTAVTINPLPTPTIGSNSPKCVGSTLNLTASGGTSYSWTGVNGFSSTAQNPTIPNVTALATGNYMVTVTNANGCTATATTAVTINPLPTPTIGSNSPKCVGSTLNLTASGGTSYSWTGVNGFSSTIQNPTIPNVTALATGNYMVTVTNANGCTATATTNITINPLPIPTIGSNSPKCVGSTLNLTASGGTSYSWTGVNGFSSTAQNPTIPNVTALTTGNYMVTVTNANGCTATATTAVTINPLPTPTIGSNSPKCVGSTLNFTASGGTSYSWTGVNGFSSTAQNPTIPNVTALTTGNYMVTVTNANGCTATATTNVTINPLPIPTIGSNSPKCVGSTLNLTASGGTSYSWTGVNGFNSTIQNPTIPNVTALATGNYMVTVTNANGCTATATTAVTINPLPTPTIGSNSPKCVGSTLNLTASGGTSYSWTGVNGFSSTIQNPTIPNVTALATGNYMVTATNANGCMATATTAVTINPLPTPTIGSNSPKCVGSTLNLTASGGTSYSWTGVNGFSSTAQNPTIPNVTALTTGNYMVTVTNANGCTATATTNVTINPLPIPTIGSNSPKCVGSTLNFTASGGTSYSWTGVNGFNSTIQNPKIFNVTALTTGNYMVTVTNTNGCTATATTNVTINPLPIPTIGSNSPKCVGSTLNFTASGGTSYSWAGVNGFSSTAQNPTIPNVTALATGNYMVTVTNANGCTATATTAVTINPLPTPTIGSNSPKCVGSTLNLTASGGTSYSWTGVNGFSSTAQNPTIPNVTALTTGNYMVTVTNTNGCTATATTNVTINPLPIPTIGSNSPKCVGSTLNLTTSGGTSYSWTGVNGFNSTIQNPTIPNVTALTTGNYMVTVTNTNGCTATATTNVTINPLPIPTIGSNSPKCVGSTLNFTASGGTSYSWTGVNGFSSTAQNPTIPNVTALATGNYMVTVTNTNGCTATATTNVTINPLPIPTIGSNSPKCVGSTLNFTASGGTSYSWTGVNGFSSTAQNPTIPNVTALATGNYMVTVTNTNGCTATATINVTINPPPTATASSAGICNSGFSIGLSSSGGSSYFWQGPNGFTSNSQNAGVKNFTTAIYGTYTVTVTNSLGCSATATSNISIPAPPTASGTTIQSGQSTILSATGCSNFIWYAERTGGIPISNLNTLNTGVLTTTTIYYVQCGCLPTNRTPVSVTVTNSPCPSTLNISGNQTGTQVQKAINTITAPPTGNTTTIQTGANITFSAGKSVLLQPGFKTETGTVFKAETSGCN